MGVRPKAASLTRISWVDHARGIAILMIVYRHVTSGMIHTGLEVTSGMYDLQEIFFNFRMPVFFVLSGVFVANSLRKRDRKTIVEDKISTILYPYLLWSLIIMSLQILFSQYTTAKKEWSDLFCIIYQPRTIHLWYLLAMFNSCMLYLALSRWIKNIYVHFAIAVVLHVLTFIPAIKNLSLLSDPFFFYWYFFIGTCMAPILLDKEKSASFLKARNLKWILPLFVLGQWFWFTHRQETPQFMFIVLVINLIACYFVYIVSRQIALRGNDWLAYLGQHSLYIYILHVPVASAMRGLILYCYKDINSWLLLLICWIAGFVIPIILYHLFVWMGLKGLFTLRPKSET